MYNRCVSAQCYCCNNCSRCWLCCLVYAALSCVYSVLCIVYASKSQRKNEQVSFLCMESSVLFYTLCKWILFFSVSHFIVGTFAQLFLLMFRAQVIHSIIKTALTHKCRDILTRTHAYLKLLEALYSTCNSQPKCNPVNSTTTHTHLLPLRTIMSFYLTRCLFASQMHLFHLSSSVILKETEQKLEHQPESLLLWQ